MLLKKQLECWYAKHQQNKRHSYLKDYDNCMGAQDWEHELLLKIYHDDDDRQLHDHQRMPNDRQQGLAMAVLEIE